MTATIVKRDEEIERLKGVLLEIWMWSEKWPFGEYTDYKQANQADKELEAIVDKVVTTLNTYKQQ